MRAILLPLVEPELDRHSVELALTLAGKVDAHVTALLALTDFSSLHVYGHYPMTAGWGELVERTHQHAERREIEVRRLLDELGVLPLKSAEPSPDAKSPLSLRVAFGNDDEVVADCALTHDLILFPRRSANGAKPLPTSSLLKCTLESAGRPLLVVTDELGLDFPKTVAIAWNGSVEAARAVTTALPFLTRAERVHVLTFATSRTEGSKADQLVSYLSRHGIAAEKHVREPEGSVGEELLEQASELSADLLVMGGYTHSRLRQTLFGGVTHHVLDNAALPLFMAR
ncbi:universal stress protein [Sphingomonas lenta]|uniref:UspA domain-containing protein n=1 Tax=Sphingomonas lenta TaxID=1141887 RepID=A0A2A2SHY4_9SPHN|nr:universal stress protein [Sphingomonas lenta]PAX08856.1 hypothetical protein CKY28_05745 [Sphingomonas lenta]